MIMALAKGIFCNVVKYKTKAEPPKIPLSNSTFLLFPKILILAFLRKYKHKATEIMERTKTTCVEGI